MKFLKNWVNVEPRAAVLLILIGVSLKAGIVLEEYRTDCSTISTRNSTSWSFRQHSTASIAKAVPTTISPNAALLNTPFIAIKRISDN